jgi:hypothetical protein
MRSIADEAKKLGISFLSVAGGEPLSRPEIADSARDSDRLRGKMERLRRAGVFCLSFTITSANFDAVTDTAFLDNAVEAGRRLFFHREWRGHFGVPFRVGS